MEAAISAKVYPAYQKLIDYFSELLPKTTTDDGVWKLPDGEAFYAYMLRQNTTTTLKPEEIHELGVARGGADRSGDARDSRRERFRRSADRRWPWSRWAKIRVSFSE